MDISRYFRAAFQVPYLTTECLRPLPRPRLGGYSKKGHANECGPTRRAPVPAGNFRLPLVFRAW
jgi:hypothetical protein